MRRNETSTNYVPIFISIHYYSFLSTEVKKKKGRKKEGRPMNAPGNQSKIIHHRHLTDRSQILNIYIYVCVCMCVRAPYDKSKSPFVQLECDNALLSAAIERLATRF